MKTKTSLMQAITAALIAPPQSTQETRIIPANVLEVRVKRTALIPAQPAAIRPLEIPFQPVHGLAVPGFMPYVISLFSHTHRELSGNFAYMSYQVDPATVMIEDICERVYLTRFKYQTMRAPLDPVLPVFSQEIFERTDYPTYMRQTARLLPDYAKGKVGKYQMVEAINHLLTFIGTATQISRREATFASWHLIGALENPKKYI